MTAWIQFKAEVESEDRSIVQVDMVDKAFSIQMMEVFQGSDFDKIIN